MFPDLCPVCHYLTYKEEEGEYYSDGMKISPDEGYCSHCEYRYSEHVKHSTKEQVEKHIKWLKKMSDIYKEVTKDHVIPISKGGHNIKENVVPACGSCNSKKHDKILI